MTDSRKTHAKRKLCTPPPRDHPALPGHSGILARVPGRTGQPGQTSAQPVYLLAVPDLGAAWLDSAAADITAAERKARSEDCSDAEYLAADAYRNLEKADQDLLQLGRDLQALFNLDVEITNSP